LPDGLLSNQKSQFGKKIPVPQIGKCWYILWPFGIFFGHLVYFMNIWFHLCLFGTFFRFWYHATRKIWQPCSGQRQTINLFAVNSLPCRTHHWPLCTSLLANIVITYIFLRACVPTYLSSYLHCIFNDSSKRPTSRNNYVWVWEQD
jgi:hypothetical protein